MHNYIELEDSNLNVLSQIIALIGSELFFDKAKQMYFSKNEI